MFRQAQQPSTKELTRLEMMQRLSVIRLSQKETANLLGLSIRQIKRLSRKYREVGAQGLVSHRFGKATNHRLDEKVSQQALDLLMARYKDFGPTLAHEKLVEVDQLWISRESVRKLMIDEELWKPRRAKKVSVHPMRERQACFGELVQIDGSDHIWFEGRGPRCTLLVFIDDATGNLLELWFAEAESFFAYGEVSRHYFERYGKPVAFYSKKHGVFYVNTPQTIGSGTGLTQFGRAMQELDVQIICANSPLAKGRLERANQTLQDRLVKELRLQGITTFEAANAFAPKFCADFNRRFAVAPRSKHGAHRPLPNTENPDFIFTRQKTTTLSKNLSVQYQKVIYRIQSDWPSYALRNAPVTIFENAKGEITILYKNQPLPYTTFKKIPCQSEVVETKQLNRALQPPNPLLPTIRGDSMDSISMAYPFKRYILWHRLSTIGH